MTNDPFEQFERSRFGWSIPLVLFIVGSVLTYLAVNSLHGIWLREVDAARAAQVDQGGDLQKSNSPVEIDDSAANKNRPEVSGSGAKR
ncbi:MAG: hypothetical protein L7W43_00305 [Rubripirellula sp.]|nr:hypothetical protein [Rhodopirellula sp.]MCH1438065.1 hypothetical protein [Rubripirellula sp.]